MPHPLHFIKGLISQNLQITGPKPIYILVPYDKTYSLTHTLCPPGFAPTPSLHKRPFISEIIRIPTPKPYIFLFVLIRRIQGHRSWVSYAPTSSLHKGQISQKPFRSPPQTIYILVPYDKTHSMTQASYPPPPTLHFRKGPRSQKPFRSPPLNHSYFSCSS